MYFFGRTFSCPTSIVKASPSPLRAATPSSSVKLPLSQYLVFRNLERNNWVHFAPSPGEKASGYQTDRNVQVPQIHRGDVSAPRFQSVHRTTMLSLRLNRIDYKRDHLLPCIIANVTRMRLDNSWINQSTMTDLLAQNQWRSSFRIPREHMKMRILNLPSHANIREKSTRDAFRRFIYRSLLQECTLCDITVWNKFYDNFWQVLSHNFFFEKIYVLMYYLKQFLLNYLQICVTIFYYVKFFIHGIFFAYISKYLFQLKFSLLILPKK